MRITVKPISILKRVATRSRVVNGPTGSGPNPKTNLKPKSCPKKNESYVRSEKFSNVAKLFWLYFCAPKIKSTSQARFKPEIFVNFRPEPDPKSPARLTTLTRSPLSGRSNFQISDRLNRTLYCQLLATAAKFVFKSFQKELCCPESTTPWWVPHTRYTLRRNTASMIKVKI